MQRRKEACAARETLPAPCPPFFGACACGAVRARARRAQQTGCFAGAAGLGKRSQGVQRRAQRRRKRRVARTGECSLDAPCRWPRRALKGRPAIRCGPAARAQRRPKSYRRDNCFVARESPHRPRWLILRCRLSGPWRCTRRQAWNCSFPNADHELGSDRREPGWFYPLAAAPTRSARQYERNAARATARRGAARKRVPHRGVVIRQG